MPTGHEVLPAEEPLKSGAAGASGTAGAGGAALARLAVTGVAWKGASQIVVGATQRSLLMRDIRFRSLEIRAVAGLAVGAPAAILVALSGGGAWAFVALELCAAATSTTLLWVLVPWRPTLSYSRRSLGELGGF